MDFLDKLKKPKKTEVNIGLRVPTAPELNAILGEPRSSFTGECQPVTNAKLKARIKTRSFGSFRVTGLDVALDSLGVVMKQIETEIPDLRKLIGTAGMTCARKVRLKNGALGRRPSSHSWGTAIDLTIGGKLDTQGDDKTFRGLLIMSKFFNAHNWFWGVTFPTEDAMHFEVSFQLLSQWKKDGLV